MMAHKVPATYFSAWRIPETKRSFFVFYKDEIQGRGKSKKYKNPNSITAEHLFFMEENFYYLDLEKLPGLIYKLEEEINCFFDSKNYNIKCVDDSCEKCEQDECIVDIVDYDKYMKYRTIIDTWDIRNESGVAISTEVFKQELAAFVFQKVGTIIEEEYFAKKLEPKWVEIREEIALKRNAGDNVVLSCLDDFLEFFVLQYIRVDDIIIDDIEPVVHYFSEMFKSIGFMGKDEDSTGLLDPDSYFYTALLDIAKGNIQRLNNKIQIIKTSYIIDILHSPPEVGYITSTSPCVVAEKKGNFKSVMVFPISPDYCIRFLGKSNCNGRNGQFFEQTIDEVKDVNQCVIRMSRNIVISESEYIADRI